ncbi:MAG: TonB-dependent receptor, partial [Myxococcales bacterium]|nr:TonB-dependent receptor [Myxococcales bacterium]
PAREPVVNFSGELVVRGTREPLPGLVVSVFRGSPRAPEQAFEAITDDEGRFEFFDLVAGDWNVLVEAEGYFPVRSTEKVTAGERTHVRYLVERGAYNPYDVLVEADRPRREVSRTSLHIEQIERIPGTAGDALAVIQNLPGVARPTPFSGDIIVRGAAPEDTRVVVESMSVPIIYHFGSIRSVLPTPILAGIDFYPGNFGPEYGRAIGGIVDVRLKRLSPERIGGVLDVSLLDTSLYVEAPVTDKGAVAVAVRRSYIDYLLDAAVSNSDEVNLINAPRYYDAQLLAQYRPARGHEIRAFSMLSDDEFKLLFSDPGEGDVRLTGNQLLFGVDFHRTFVDYTYTPSERFQNTLRIAGGEDHTRFELAQFEFDVQSLQLQLRDTARFQLRDDVAFTVGLDHISQRLDYRVFLPPPPREGVAADPRLEDAVATEVNDRDVHAFGAFTQLEWTILERLTLYPGLRFDHFTRIDENVLSPRFTARHTLTDQWTLKGGVGLFYQEPPFDETDPVFGNPDADAEGAVHYALGAEYRPEKHLLVDVTAFYKTLFDLIAPSEEIVERDGELVEEQVANSGSGRVYGAELMLRHELSDNFMGWVAYTLMRSERRDRPGDPLRLFSQDQTHILTAVGTYRLPRNWEISARWRLVSGNPDTPIVGAVFNADRDEYDPIFGALNSDRIAPFHQLDVRVDKRWIWPELVFSLYLDIQNIYNRANPEGFQYSFDYTERQKAQGLPIVPILGLRAEY